MSASGASDKPDRPVRLELLIAARNKRIPCAQCKKPLNLKPFYMFFGERYCQACGERLFAEKLQK